MGHELKNIGHLQPLSDTASEKRSQLNNDIVLEKSIFHNIFEKDIKRVYIYKKTERIAKALALIAPAFSESKTLSNTIEQLQIDLLQAAMLTPVGFRTELSKHLLTLASVLSLGRVSAALSSMNIELINREVLFLLNEIAVYESPRLALEEVPTFSDLTRSAIHFRSHTTRIPGKSKRSAPGTHVSEENLKNDTGQYKGHNKDRRELVLSVIKGKGQVSIKDISHLIPSVSEKTVQRELSALINEGLVTKHGERRWSVYSLA